MWRQIDESTSQYLYFASQASRSARGPLRWSLTVEEIGVKTGLDDSRDDGDGIDRVLCKVPVDPVRDVQATVEAERKEVVGRNRLGFTCPLQHEELGQDSDRLEVDGERPEDFDGCAGQCDRDSGSAYIVSNVRDRVAPHTTGVYCPVSLSLAPTLPILTIGSLQSEPGSHTVQRDTRS